VAVFHVEPDGSSHRAAIAPRRFADATRLAARERDFLQKFSEAEKAHDRGDVRQARQALLQARGVAGFENDARALRLNNALGWGFPRAALRAAWPIRELRGHASSVNCVVITHDGSIAVSGGGMEGTSRDAWTLKVWDLATGKPERDLLGAGGPVHYLEWDGTDQRVTAWSDDARRRTWDVAAGTIIATADGWERGQNSLRSAMAATPDRSTIVCGDTLAPSLDENFAIWFADAAGEKWRRSPDQHAAHILAVRVSRDGERAFSASADGTLRMWRISDGECLHVFEGHRGSVAAFDLTVDDRFLVSGGADTTLRVWDVDTGECVAILRNHLAAVTSVAVPARGGHVISGDRSGVLVVWEFDFDFADTANGS
jgi:WD40 repeat protein